MTPITEQFVIAEQAANALVEELTSLKAETLHYSAAATSLELAGQRLGNLASEATDLSTRAGEIIRALREIGTPQLLGGLEDLTARYSEHATQLGALHQVIHGATEQTAAVSSAIQNVVKDLRLGHSETGKTLKQVLTRLDHVGTTSIATEQKSSQAVSQLESLSGAISSVETRVDAARTALNQLQGQSDRIFGAVGGIASRLEAHAASSEQRLQGLAGEATRVFQVARLMFITAGAALGMSLIILVYLLVTHR